MKLLRGSAKPPSLAIELDAGAVDAAFEPDGRQEPIDRSAVRSGHAEPHGTGRHADHAVVGRNRPVKPRRNRQATTIPPRGDVAHPLRSYAVTDDVAASDRDKRNPDHRVHALTTFVKLGSRHWSRSRVA